MTRRHIVDESRMRILRWPALAGVGALVAGILMSTPFALAHPLAPALLEFVEEGDGLWRVRWKTSIVRAPGAREEPILPPDCVLGEAVEERGESSVTIRFEMRCRGGLIGERVGVAGLETVGVDALVRMSFLDGRILQRVVRAAEPEIVVPAQPSRWAVFYDYARLGVDHILGGPDHLLFVFGLVLLTQTLTALLATITAFTIGHSITLALAALDWIQVPQGPVEVAIAASIFVLAVELARPEERRDGFGRRPWWMAFCFGLLHGLGFAGALREAGLPSGEIPLALFSFNLGLESGQIAFVLVVVAFGLLVRRLPRPLPAWARAVPVYLIGSLAAFWFFQRLAMLFV